MLQNIGKSNIDKKYFVIPTNNAELVFDMTRPPIA